MTVSAPSTPHNPLPAVQAALAATDLDGWLLYDFRHLNPHAARVLRISPDIFLTRRYFVWVPREGRAVVVHNHIEGGNWQAITREWATEAGPAELWAVGAHAELDAALRNVVTGKRLAMEYSPGGEVPPVSRVDAGTVERVRAAGAADIVSSADLLQSFLRWSGDDLAAHERAVAVLMRAKDKAFQLIHDRLRAGEPVTELEVQAGIMAEIGAAGMDAGHPVNVSFGVNAADSHYEPGEGKNATLQPGQCVLIDLWAQERGRPFADVTWVGYAQMPPARYLDAWAAVKGAREAALELLRDRWGQAQGWEADRAAREAMGAEWEAHFLHRTGHDLGVQIHGAGANLDDYETHDTRALTPGLAVTIEPGTYPTALGFGIRSEVNVFLSPDGPQVTTPAQAAPYVLGRGDWESVKQSAEG
ncbi:Xaa-Pro aminopeptidase [Deinococcus reticulitermitis]|uniref:Xaa-Pro aminopeptidase n=1 Tax=Deinococcus reticulitermitis TaxID=856736 RepID=A0A1H7BD15_9DEIO|nr:M24 family metallopeptidase [Deinococcus reticulitermitis]SEJ74814.1 Xaa-Pro aminopeptidase [Deinococcus reticulitermitis]